MTVLSGAGSSSWRTVDSVILREVVVFNALRAAVFVNALGAAVFFNASKAEVFFAGVFVALGTAVFNALGVVLRAGTALHLSRCLKSAFLKICSLLQQPQVR